LIIASQRRSLFRAGGPRLFAALAQKHMKHLAGFGLQHAGDRPQRFAAFGAALLNRIGCLFHVAQNAWLSLRAN
jgi:hypothetical protein